MEEKLITIETARLAKEKGFDGMCYGGYSPCITNPIWIHTDGKFKSLSFRNRNNINDSITLAPTQALLQKWLREVHGIHVNPEPYHETADHTLEITGYYVGQIDRTDGRMLHLGDDNYSTYEEALEKGLIAGLNFI